MSFFMDAHMHFDLYKDKHGILKYIEDNKSYTIAVTNLPELYKKYYSESWNYKYIRLALGFHPQLAWQYRNQITIFKEFYNSTRFIGEVGLDYSVKSEDNIKQQKEVFEQIISLCKYDKNKIMSVHSRQADDDCLSMLKLYEGKVILHWYTGSIENLKIALSRGYYFSINHQMIRSKNGKKIISYIPINRIVIESDAPFTIGLNSNYNLTFINEIIEFLSMNKKMEREFLFEKIKGNFKKILL